MSWVLVVYLSIYEPDGVNTGDVFGAFATQEQCRAAGNRLVAYYGPRRVACIPSRWQPPIGAICQPDYPGEVATLPPCRQSSELTSGPDALLNLSTTSHLQVHFEGLYWLHDLLTGARR